MSEQLRRKALLQIAGYRPPHCADVVCGSHIIHIQGPVLLQVVWIVVPPVGEQQVQIVQPLGGSQQYRSRRRQRRVLPGRVGPFPDPVCVEPGVLHPPVVLRHFPVRKSGVFHLLLQSRLLVRKLLQQPGQVVHVLSHRAGRLLGHAVQALHGISAGPVFPCGGSALQIGQEPPDQRLGVLCLPRPQVGAPGLRVGAQLLALRFILRRVVIRCHFVLPGLQAADLAVELLGLSFAPVVIRRVRLHVPGLHWGRLSPVGAQTLELARQALMLPPHILHRVHCAPPAGGAHLGPELVPVVPSDTSPIVSLRGLLPRLPLDALQRGGDAGDPAVPVSGRFAGDGEGRCIRPLRLLQPPHGKPPAGRRSAPFFVGQLAYCKSGHCAQPPSSA